MPFSRNPATGKIETYTDNGFYLGHVVTMGDLISQNIPKSVSDGGPGSGNHHHAGRPGFVGGSAPKGGGSGFGGIAKAATDTHDAKEFVNSLDSDQKKRLEKQKKETGTSEDLEQYAGRLQNAIKNPAEPPSGQYRVANGKNISETYKYRGIQATGSTKGTHEVDTMIEDVIHQQGFDGIPRVVSTEEFEKITEEHPEMPILMRAYTAKNKEKLDEYTKDLEEGFFYVDCGYGGAQYGSGMYTAGAYLGEPASEVEEWNDPELETDTLGNPFVLTIKGEGYKAKAVFPEESGDLFVGTPYVYESFKDGERHIYMMDEDSLLWVDENGSLVDEGSLNEMIRLGEGTFFECEKMDLSIYKDKARREKQEHIKGASREMDHYIMTGIDRIWREDPPSPPAGMSLARDESEYNYYYFNPQKEKDVHSDPPEDGKLIVLTDQRGLQPAIYQVNGDKLVKLGGTYSMKLNPKDKWDNEVPSGWKWAEIEGKIEGFEPVGTARMMTLDPSARIASTAEINDIVGGSPTRAEEEAAIKEHFDNNLSGYTPDETEYMRFVYGYPGYKEPSFSKAYGDLCKRIDRERRDELHSIATSLKGEREYAFDSLLKKCEERGEMLRSKFGEDADLGVVAAALGYDAINAEFHGQSMSYTVVLNRTKVILRKEPL